MTIRIAKLLLLSGVAFFYCLVVFNNLTDYDSNWQFVRHVLAMDTTFPGNKGMWRSITSMLIDRIFYFGIIGWEIVTTVLLCWGILRMFSALRRPADVFDRAKHIPVLGLVISLLMWLVAFLSIGGEWFLMWQSRIWNGQEAAFRNFTIVGIVFLILIQPDREHES